MSNKQEHEIFGLLNNDIADYEEPSGVEITDGYFFNMKETINKIELYRASKFKSGDRDSQGDKKFFYNIVNPQCGNATKNIDIDRKDVRVKANDGNHRIQAMIYNEELKYWMRENNIGYLFNKISEELPKYGSVIIKKVKDDVKFIPMRRCKFDPAVNNDENNYNIQSSYFIEEHYYQPDGLRKMVKKGWDKKVVDELIENMRKNQDNDILVYEYYTEMPKSEGSDTYEMSVAYMSMIDVKTDKGKSFKGNNTKTGKLLFKGPVKKMPYKKIDYLTIEGRGLGLGIIEMLFDPQQRKNEMANQKAKSMKLSSKHIFQTRDTAVEGNIMTDVMDGDVLKVNSEITPLANEERNLGAYAQEEGILSDIIRSNANAFEITTGEGLPSRTPFRLGALMNQNAGKLFDFIRQNISMFWEEVLTEWILPSFDAEMIKEHVFEIQDIKVIRAIVERDVNRRMNDAVAKYTVKFGKYPTIEEEAALEEIMKAQVSDIEFAEIIEGYLDFEKKVYIDISGEQDPIQEVETYTNMLMLMAQNPNILQDPSLRDMLETLMAKTGIQTNLGNGGGAAPQAPPAQIAAGAPGAGTPGAPQA